MSTKTGFTVHMAAVLVEGAVAFIDAFPLYKSANGMPFNTIRYHSVPLNTIEDIKGKFVGLNGTLVGKKTTNGIR